MEGKELPLAMRNVLMKQVREAFAEWAAGGRVPEIAIDFKASGLLHHFSGYRLKKSLVVGLDEVAVESSENQKAVKQNARKSVAANQNSNSATITDVVTYCESLGKELYFVGWFGNLGDALITAGTYAAFAKAGVALKPWDQKTAHTGMALVVGAGGSLVPLYHESASQLAALQQLPVADIIILPATVQGHETLLRQLDNRFHFFCRDRVSYDYLSRLLGSDKLFPD